MNDSTNTLLKDNHAYLDLSLPSNPDDQYVCEDCGIALALFPQARITNPHAGICYICPKCHNVTDTSLTGMKHSDIIKPIELSDPSFMIVPENKGHFIPRYKSMDEYDPEPQEEEILKAKGAKILDKRLEVKNDLS